MRITRIDFEGKRGRYATAQRRVGAGNAPNVVVVTILTPDQPNGREHHVLADCEDDLMAHADEFLVRQRSLGPVHVLV